EAVESGASGHIISEIIDGQKRYTVALRLPDQYRADGEAMSRIVMQAPGGERVTLGDVTRVELRRGAEVINREQGQRRVVVMTNVRGRDLGSFVDEVRDRMGREMQVPSGYFVEYSGQFENQERATRRLILVVPLVVGVIFVLLYVTFNSIKQ